MPVPVPDLVPPSNDALLFGGGRRTCGGEDPPLSTWRVRGGSTAVRMVGNGLDDGGVWKERDPSDWLPMAEVLATAPRTNVSRKILSQLGHFAINYAHLNCSFRPLFGKGLYLPCLSV